MSYDQCPTCGDDQLRRVRENVVECASCRTPLRDRWLTESYLEGIP